MESRWTLWAVSAGIGCPSFLFIILRCGFAYVTQRRSPGLADCAKQAAMFRRTVEQPEKRTADSIMPKIQEGGLCFSELHLITGFELVEHGLKLVDGTQVHHVIFRQLRQLIHQQQSADKHRLSEPRLKQYGRDRTGNCL